MGKIGSLEVSSLDSPRKQSVAQAARDPVEGVDSTKLACSVDLWKIEPGSD